MLRFYNWNKVNTHRDKFITQLQVNNKNIDFEVDSGAAVTIANNKNSNAQTISKFDHPTNLQLIISAKTHYKP